MHLYTNNPDVYHIGN